MNVSMLSKHVFNQIFWLQLICIKKAGITTLSAKKALASGGRSPPDPQLFFLIFQQN